MPTRAVGRPIVGGILVIRRKQANPVLPESARSASQERLKPQFNIVYSQIKVNYHSSLGQKLNKILRRRPGVKIFLYELHSLPVVYTILNVQITRYSCIDPSSSPVLGPVLLHVRSSGLRRSSTLVPPRSGTLLPRHHLFLPLLPMLSRATQQAGGQLADGGEFAKSKPMSLTSKISFSGVLVHSRRHLCLLHRLCGHARQLQRQSRR